jgi:hypothetical protein
MQEKEDDVEEDKEEECNSREENRSSDGTDLPKTTLEGLV